MRLNTPPSAMDELNVNDYLLGRDLVDGMRKQA
jgi:hypothetical protein